MSDAYFVLLLVSTIVKHRWLERISHTHSTSAVSFITRKIVCTELILISILVCVLTVDSPQIPSIPTGLFVSAKGEGCCLMQVKLPWGWRKYVSR